MLELNLWRLGEEEAKRREEEAKRWRERQFALAFTILYERIIPLIKTSWQNSDELVGFLERLVEESYSYLVAGMETNPLHHSFQVLENMIKALKYELLKNTPMIKEFIALALLHDIGDAEASGTKIKTSDIKDAIKEGKPEVEIQGMVQQAIDFRKEHMEKGAQIARRFIFKYLEETIAESICKVIGEHDFPTIAFHLDEFGQYSEEHFEKYLFLLPDHHSAIILREADRLWMISPEGIEKDIMDSILNNKSPKSPQEKLAYNLERFDEERALYDKSVLKHPYGFWKDTFFSYRGCVEVFLSFLQYWKEYPKMWVPEKNQAVFHKYLS